MLANLLAPLRLPERVLEALDRLVESTRELGPIRSELTHVREQTEPLAELAAGLEDMHEDLATRLDSVRDVIVALESDRSHINRTVGEVGTKLGALHDVLAPVDDRLGTIESTLNGLAGEVRALHQTLSGVKEDIQRTTGLQGDRGVMERARDAITGKE